MDSESVPALKSPSDSPRELRQIFFKAGVPMTPKEYLWPDPAASATEPPEKSSEGPPEARPSVGLGDDSSNRPAAAAAKVTPRSSELYPAVDSSGSSTKIKDPWRSSEHHPAVDSAESSAITKDSIAAPEAVATAAAAGKTTDPPGDSPDAGTQGDTPSEGEGGVLSSKSPPSGKRRYGSGLMLPRSLFRRRGRDSQSGKERGLEIESGKTVEGSLKGREVASREGKGVVGGETGEEIRAVGVSAPLTAVDLGPENSGGRAAAGEMGMEGEGSSAGERGRHAEGEVQPSRGAVGKEGEGLSADSEEGEESEENEEREKSEEGVAIAAKDNASGRAGGTKGEGISEGVREGGEGRGVARAVEGRAERVEGSTGVVTLRRMKDALRNVLWPQREQREKQTHARASPGELQGNPVTSHPPPASQVHCQRTASALPAHFQRTASARIDTPLLVPSFLTSHVPSRPYYALLPGPPVDAPPSPLSHVPPKRTASLPSDTLLLHHEVPAVLVTEQPLTGMREAAMLSHPPPHTPAAAASGDAASAASAAHNPLNLAPGPFPRSSHINMSLQYKHMGEEGPVEHQLHRLGIGSLNPDSEAGEGRGGGAGGERGGEAEGQQFEKDEEEEDRQRRERRQEGLKMIAPDWGEVERQHEAKAKGVLISGPAPVMGKGKGKGGKLGVEVGEEGEGGVEEEREMVLSPPRRIGGDRGKAGELPHSPPPSPVSPAPVSPSLVSPPPRSPPRLEGSTEKKKPARPRLKLPFFSPPAPTVASAAAAGGASASAARTPPCLDFSAAPSSPAAEAAEKLRERARRMGTRQQSQFEGRGEQKGKTEKEEQVEVRGRKEMEEQVAGVFTAAEWDKMSDTQGSIQHATKALKGRTSSLGSQGNRGEMGKSDEPVGVGPVLSGRELKQMEGAQAMVKSASWNLKWDAEEFKEE
ncbi:unnamed protein product [Closterium sp. NIES-53]